MNPTHLTIQDLRRGDSTRFSLTAPHEMRADFEASCAAALQQLKPCKLPLPAFELAVRRLQKSTGWAVFSLGASQAITSRVARCAPLYVGAVCVDLASLVPAYRCVVSAYLAAIATAPLNYPFAAIHAPARPPWLTGYSSCHADHLSPMEVRQLAFAARQIGAALARKLQSERDARLAAGEAPARIDFRDAFELDDLLG